jgi:hypothetical protein
MWISIRSRRAAMVPPVKYLLRQAPPAPVIGHSGRLLFDDMYTDCRTSIEQDELPPPGTGSQSGPARDDDAARLTVCGRV